MTAPTCPICGRADVVMIRTDRYARRPGTERVAYYHRRGVCVQPPRVPWPDPAIEEMAL